MKWCELVGCAHYAADLCRPCSDETKDGCRLAYMMFMELAERKGVSLGG